MSLDTFIHQLQYETEKVIPTGWKIDWEDAPLKVKLYRGLPAFPLSPEVPLTLGMRQSSAMADLRAIGHLLWYVFGLSSICQTVQTDDSASTRGNDPVQWCRRFVPSGGALYPSEVYVYLKLSGLPFGVYHYDAAHHRLVLLREGNFDSYISRSLGNRCDLPACFGAVFVSTVFWKNFYKYNNFAYRLQGLDAGVLIGQLLETAKRFGFATGVHFQFLDRAVNRLLGVSEREESVYAVIPLSTEPAGAWHVRGDDGGTNVAAADLCREIPAVRYETYVKSRTVLEYPMLLRMNEASLLESTLSFRQLAGERAAACGGRGIEAGYEALHAAILPRVNRMSYDLASVCRQRHSPEMDFVLRRVTGLQLAVLLKEATASYTYRNDLDGPDGRPAPRVSIFGCLYGVEGVPNGAYRYDGSAHMLQRTRSGDLRFLLQQAMTMHNLNLSQVPICFHVTGNSDFDKPMLGYRGYRIAQMEAGMLVQRILLAATAIGMGGHPLLGFDARSCDALYRLFPHRQTSLIQIPVGPYRQRPRMEGSLHG